MKISFTLTGKELTRNIVQDEAYFGPKFFLTQMLLNFEVKIISCLPVNKQHDGHTLFPLIEQCFQEVGLTQWKNDFSAHCPDEESKMFHNLIKCQYDYLKAHVRFLNIGNKLIRWFCKA
jgi:hypothetical protein